MGETHSGIPLVAEFRAHQPPTNILCRDFACFYLTGKTDLLIPSKDAILTYSAVVGPTFGLVVAYYFKTTRD